MNRRDILQGMAAGLGCGLIPGQMQSANLKGHGARRVIFFLQNHGFDPFTCIPKDLKESGSLNGVPLAEPMKALEPYKDRMHIITGLHGRHTSPGHSAYFGALGGYRGSQGVPPAAATIDYVLGHALPKTMLPPLSIGMESLESMKSRPTLATLTASGPGRPIFMHSDPNNLYGMLFGSIADGDIKERYETKSEIMRQVEGVAKYKGEGMLPGESGNYLDFVQGFREINGLREKLTTIPDRLRKFAPTPDDRYLHPKFETDWHDCLLEIGIAALQANLTNVLTVASGRGEFFGSWKGLGVKGTGHGLGHMEQVDNPTWIKIRQYNSKMLVKLIQSLEAIPEGSGNMMDNTLIVYTSNNGDKQHTDGSNWPFVLLGNGGGRFQTNQYTHVENRPINDLYTTFLHGVGTEVDRFNMDKNMASLHHSKAGPIESLLA